MEKQYIEWRDYSEKLIQKMKAFDKIYMLKNKDHQCSTREDFDNGIWYCKHLEDARIRKFKKELMEEERLLSNVLPLRIRRKFG